VSISRPLLLFYHQVLHIIEHSYSSKMTISVLAGQQRLVKCPAYRALSFASTPLAILSPYHLAPSLTVARRLVPS
jgi:hypothetical protein